MSENKCEGCPIFETCPEVGKAVGMPFVYDYNDCMYWSCPSVGKPAAQRALRSAFKNSFKVSIDGNQVTLVRFGSVQKPTSFSFSVGTNGRLPTINIWAP